MQAHESVRTPTDVDESDDREWLFLRPTDMADVSVEETDDGQTEVTVPISSTTAHRSGSRMSESALESMASQLQQGKVGLWDDHGLDDMGWPEYRRQDMYGWWVDGEVKDGVLMGTARLREGDERSADLVDQLQQGMPIGFSVGYIPLEEDMVEADEGDFEGEEQRVIFDVDLLETSPVGIPDNPRAYADAPARVIARSITDAGVQLDRQSAEAVGKGVADALQQMDGEPDASDAGTDDGGETAEGTDGETNGGDDPEQNEYTEEEVQSLFDTFAENLQSAVDEARQSVAEELAESDDDDEEEDDDGDDEESEGDDPDDDDDEEDNSADVPEEVQSELEELRAKVDRLESESRESAGRKGMAAPGAADDAETEDGGDEAETSEADTEPRDALDEAVILGEN